MSNTHSGYEKNGFVNLKDKQGNVLPLYRVATMQSAEKNNLDPFREDIKRCGRRRIPKSAPPLVDFLLEAFRLMDYPAFPSRHFAIFANLSDYQTQYMRNGTGLFLVLPHETAAVSISAITDFRLTEPEKKNLYDFVRDSLKAEYLQELGVDLGKLLEYKEEFEDADYVPFHNILNYLEEQLKTNESRPTGTQGLALLDLLTEWRNVGVEALEPVRSFSGNSELADQMNISGRGKGNEVVIKGPVYYVEVKPWK